MLPVLDMVSPSMAARQSDGRLWALAFGLPVAVNTLLVVAAGWSMISFDQFRPKPSPPAAASETVRFIVPEVRPEPVSPDAAIAATVPAESPPLVPAADPSFTRTSEDQRGKRPEHPTFIGERDTEATSDAAPVPGAPPMPAQAGRAPRHPGEIESTESDYQDGDLESSAAATLEKPQPPALPTPPAPPDTVPPDTPALPAPPAPPETATQGEDVPTPGPDPTRTAPPALEHLATGPNPIDVPVPKPDSAPGQKPGAATLPKAGQPDATANTDHPKETQPPQPHQARKDPPKAPGFRGYQRKTVIQGSISRTGRSALDVEDSPLGRYQAVIGRAIELEWQRNCARYRDSIVPGYLSVRFFVDAKGKVRNVQFVGAMQTGQIQKGFTLNSIRDAAIPAMPPAVSKDFQDEPLELLFNFYF